MFTNKHFLKFTQFILIGLFSLISIYGAAGDVDQTFNASAYGLTNGTVHVIKKQQDGKYLIGGNFTDVNGVTAGGISRLNADLSADTTFNPADFGNGAGLGGTVYGIGVQSDGKIIVAGDIFGADNVYGPGVKRLLPNGLIDNSFLAPQVPQGSVYYDVIVLPNDKILVGGLRFNSDGSPDNSFSGLISGSKSMALQPDGKILAGTAVFRRYNSDGTVDNSFPVVNTDGTVESIVYLPDGKILIGGSFRNVNSFQQGGISRINADGSLDLTFNQNMLGATGIIYDIVPKSDGKFLLGGSILTYNGVTKNRIVQINADGSPDNSFQNTPAINGFAVNDIKILPDGKLLIGTSPNSAIPSLLRLNADGTLDNTINEVVSRGGIVRRITQQPDGKILIAGQFLYTNGAARSSLARLNIDGTLDATFIPESTPQYYNAVAVQTDSKIIVGGSGTQGVRRLNSDGTTDSTFAATFQSSNVTNDVAVLPDGKVLAVGILRPGIQQGTIFRFNTNGTLDTTFNVTQPNDTIFKLKVLADGKILIGGKFTQIGSILRGRIARLNADGTVDTTFNPPGGANGDVNNLDLQSDGKVVLGGDFTGLNGNTNYNRVGKLNSDGSLDTSFIQSAAINAAVIGLKAQSDGKVIVSGNFSLVGGITKLGFARFNSNGTLDSTFNPFINTAIPVGIGVLDIYQQADGKILVGGGFTKVNGFSHVRIARLLNSTVAPRVLFDYDGDGKADVSVFRASENKWYILQSSDFTVSQKVFAIGGDVPAPADFDGDGKTDVAIFRPATGDWWYQSSITNAQVQFHWGASGDIPRPGDFDGDGKTDFIVYRPSNNTWYRYGSTGAVSILAFGIADDKPLIGDFDGDGKSDVAVFRPATGDWWYAASSANNQFRTTHWGASGDIPVPADYDGDGKTDFAVYRPSQGGWYVQNSSSGSYAIQTFGLSTDRPVAADYDGDGRADIAVYRPATGIWYLQQTTAGFGGLQFGISTDIPTEGSFNQ